MLARFIAPTALSLKWTELASFRLDFWRPAGNCLAPFSPLGKLASAFIMPLLLLSLPPALFLALLPVAPLRARLFGAGGWTLQTRTLLLSEARLYLFLFVPLTFASLTLVSCGDDGSGRAFLLAAPSVTCFDSDDHRTAAALAFVLLIAHGAAAAAMLAYAVYAHRTGAEGVGARRLPTRLRSERRHAWRALLAPLFGRLRHTCV